METKPFTITIVHVQLCRDDYDHNTSLNIKLKYKEEAFNEHEASATISAVFYATSKLFGSKVIKKFSLEPNEKRNGIINAEIKFEPGNTMSFEGIGQFIDQFRTKLHTTKIPF